MAGRSQPEAELSRHDARIAEARKALGVKADGSPVDPGKMPPPVYDERGNVRPRGTKGAKPMTYAQRVAIAERLAKGETIATTAEGTSDPDED
jgi:hypothetical protein